MIERVRNEVELHRSLIHPSILRLLHYFEDAERVYLLMELAPGGELYRHLQARGQLSEAEVRPLFKAICEGVAHMHAHGIIHRDLKLSNILLAADGTPRIADFGLAVRSARQLPRFFPVETHGSGEQLTICGTPNYLAPEIVKREPYGMAADVWALGCLLFTLLTGHPPFETAQVRTTLERASRADYTMPADLSPSVVNLIQRLIQVDPSRRPPVREILEHSWFKAHASSVKQSYVQEALPPLSMARLRPAHHRTSLASFDLLGGDRLLITINPSASTGQGSRWLLDAKHLHLLKPDGTIRQSFPLSTGLAGSVAARRIYEHASRFLACLRKANPLLVLITPQFKACLRDSPTGEIEKGCWEMQFGDGQHLLYDPQSLQVTITGGAAAGEKRQVSVHSLPTAGPSLLSSRLQECLSRHRDALQTLQSYRGVYPAIIKEHSSTRRSTRSEPPLPAVAAASSPPSNNLHTLRNLNFGNLFAQAVRVNVPGLGWCLADPQQCQYLLLFDDGPSLFLAGSNRLAYHSGDPQSPSQWHPLDHNLPPLIRDRLRHLPTFIERLRRGQGQSFHSVL